MRRIWQILFWSVISAAFIGPGTVTTAAAAGSRFGHTLLWALVFSTAACLALQEASARVAIVSGRSLATAIRHRFRRGTAGVLAIVVVLGAVVLGCAAYEAGNILGSVAGIRLELGRAGPAPTLAVGLVAGGLLWFASAAAVARALGVIVALMGATFVACAVLAGPPAAALARGMIVPVMPGGSGLLVLGLIGTTVVPYNLFLGSGIARGQRLGEMRFGLTVAVVLGGAISMAVMVVGATTTGEFGFDALAGSLAARLGAAPARLFAFGLFAAGLSSAITAPLAAAVTARGLFERDGESLWVERSWRYRGVWLLVLGAGVAFGVAGVRPVPAIIVAQALNGVLLPFAAVFLLIVVNDATLMGDRGVNGAAANTVMSIVVAVTIVLGLRQVGRALAAAAGAPEPPERALVIAAVAAAALVAWPVARAVRRRS